GQHHPINHDRHDRIMSPACHDASPAITHQLVKGQHPYHAPVVLQFVLTADVPAAAERLLPRLKNIGGIRLYRPDHDLPPYIAAGGSQNPGS
ncbi:hypothetical protein, partial [Streptomyces sp. NPDC049744]|uniref:hypothetical protein n=1 Tax=Streptomyces sp. NPDC049744 TaxID=3154359 RepID=UPI003435A2E7